MLRSSIIRRPLVKCWTVPSIRCFAYHHFAPPTFLPHIRLPAAKARYPIIQAHGVHKKAGSKEAQGKQPSDSSTDNNNDEDDSSDTACPIFFLFLFFFILGARRRRERREHEGQQGELPVDANREVDFEGAKDLSCSKVCLLS
jgi:hypothetical protein